MGRGINRDQSRRALHGNARFNRRQHRFTVQGAGRFHAFGPQLDPLILGDRDFVDDLGITDLPAPIGEEFLVGLGGRFLAVIPGYQYSVTLRR